MGRDFLRSLRKKKIAVLMGGWSAERSISLRSGGAVVRALQSLGLRVVSIDVGKDIFLRLRRIKPDICFITLHGCPGEDGTIQAILELLKIPYTGSGVLASALGINKIYSKQIFVQNKILTPEWEVVKPIIDYFPTGDLPKGDRLPITKFSLPVVVKPASQGSTIGITIVRKKAELAEAVKKAFRYDKEIIVEKYIKGMEITVGILGQRALPVIEIVPQQGNKFYNYQAKYARGGSEHIIPARLGKRKLIQAQKLGLKAHNSLGCRGFSRVDMRVTSEGKIYVLEVNTIPGMTETSLIPEAAKAVGIEFPELVLEIIKCSLGKK